MRMHGHAAHDNAWYVPKKLFAEWKAKDPIERLERQLLHDGALTAAKKEAMLAKMTSELEEAVTFAESAPYPPAEEAPEGVFAP
jgi:pyruvate dehydrogenase E1 component alpha subunit